MGTKYTKVFEPIRIGKVEVANRLFMPAHGLGMLAGGPHGSRVPSQASVDYYRERASGGVGLLFHSSGVNPRDSLVSAYYEDSVPAFTAVAEAVHAEGSRLFGQIHYYYNHRSPWEPMSPSAPVLGVSPYQNWQYHHVCYEMSVAEILELIRAHARCARNFAAAGYDGIEIHCAHGMTGEQFLSPYFNKRSDQYGGSLENRMRFLNECLVAVREAVGPSRALGIRLNCDEMLPGGLTQEDSKEIVARLVQAGTLDFINLDISVEPQQTPFMTTPAFLPPLHMTSFIANVGQPARGKVVVMGTPGRLTSLADAEGILQEKAMDMVGAVRALIAEPDLVKNAREGREALNRVCTACNYCVLSGVAGGCTINPSVSREGRWGRNSFVPADKRGTVVVIGGGPAGLEAARVCALRGHRVILLEKSQHLGGQLRLWASLPNRDQHAGTIAWYAARLEELGVQVRLGSEASVRSVLSLTPDAVIVAGGARYDRTGETGFMASPIPGADRSTVYSPEQILGEGARPKGRVLILDEESMHTASGIAEVLAEAGAQVELITREFSAFPDLLNSLESIFIDAKLKSLGAKITTQTFLKEIGEGTATVFDIVTNMEETRAVDAVVLATMRRPATTLGRQLEGKVAQLFVIGDAASPRGMAEATYEGQRFARLIGEPGAPATMLEAMFSASPSNAFTGFAPAKPAAAC